MNTRRSTRPVRLSASRKAMRSRGARRGFTLVSMLVALILLGVGVSALARASTETLKSQNIAQNKTNAIAIGRGYIEEVRTRDPWLLQSEPVVQVDGDGTAL